MIKNYNLYLLEDCTKYDENNILYSSKILLISSFSSSNAFKYYQKKKKIKHNAFTSQYIGTVENQTLDDMKIICNEITQKIQLEIIKKKYLIIETFFT